ncbi:chemokine XC receptor 1 [Salarias fasciatus]|uniref:Chemokine XC receptor 1-like n=1 Tax=Salarias fasciatus TaxID=181472 RepID=A0A672G5F6_SALFA|nr:chemokine XC receptor 1-like [Salarias fasciatus]
MSDSLSINNSTPNYSYEYDEYYDDEVCNKTSVKDFGATFTPVFFSIIVVLSLVGNILILVILVKYENLKSLNNTLILNLAMSDLLFTTGLPFWAYNHMQAWTLGELACKVVSFTFYLGFYSSSILLILMTIHRYVAVICPLLHNASTTGIYSVIASLLIWGLSVLSSIPAVMFVTVDSEICGSITPEWSLWGLYQQNAFFLLTALVFIFCYSQIMYRLLHPTVQRRRTRSVKLIFMLMVVFFVGWLPYNTVIAVQSLGYQPSVVVPGILKAECEKSKMLDYIFFVTRLLAYSHCYLNPIFYVFVGINFKNHLKKLLKTWGDNSNSSIRSRRSRLTITSITSGDEFSLAAERQNI